MRKLALLVAAALAAATLPAGAAETLKIGFITTSSGPAAIIGKHQRDGFELGLDHLGRKIGGLETEVIYGDDQLKPDVGKQLADKFVKSDKVHFVGGIVWSNVMMAAYAPIVRSETFLVTSSAGPSPIAGAECSPFFFTTGWQNDNGPEAMAHYLNEQKVDNVYLMAPNYQAGKDMLAGFKHYYKGKVAGEVYTSLGQTDYSAEISNLRAANPGAVFFFYPGALAIQFVKQMAQSGIKTPLYSSYSVDDLTLPAIGDAAVGSKATAAWGSDFTNEANTRFVAEFQKKYGYTPSFFAATAYDSAMLIDSAVRAVGGKLGDKAGLQKALKAADFKSVRGPFRYNANHFSIQGWHLQEVVRGADGKPALKTVAKIFDEHKDRYQKDCPMK